MLRKNCFAGLFSSNEPRQVCQKVCVEGKMRKPRAQNLVDTIRTMGQVEHAAEPDIN